MDRSVKIQLLEKRKWVIIVGMVALTHLLCQSLMLPYGNALLSMLPDEKSENVVVVTPSIEDSAVESLIDDKVRVSGVLNLENEQSLLVRGVKSAEGYNARVNAEGEKESTEKNGKEEMDSGLDGDGTDEDVDFVEDEALDDVDVDLEEGFTVDNSTQIEEASSGVMLESRTSGVQGKKVTDGSVILPTPVASLDKPLLIGSVVGEKPESGSRISDGSAFSNNGSSMPNKSAKKKMRCDMPPKTVTPIDEMERLLVHHRARSRAMVCHFLDVCRANVFDFSLQLMYELFVFGL